MSLYHDYRPESLEAIWGQGAAVETIQSWVSRQEIPHAILLTGPSGCGKTTIARILKDLLNVGDINYTEINTADFRGIDTIREIRKSAGLSAFNSGNKLWLIDECHQLTSAAQDAILKMLEDTPTFAYFVLATTDPKKLTKTLKSRCSVINLKSLSDEDLMGLVGSICDAEAIEISTDVIEKIANHSEGSARQALVLLDKISGLETEEAILAGIDAASNEKEGIDLCRELFSTRSNWKSVCQILKPLKENKADPETIRRIVLGYATTILLSGGNNSGRAFYVITAFEKPYYDSGFASLAASCYDVMTADEL